MTTVHSVQAGEENSIPVVATVRDYWPVCYFGTMFSNKINDRNNGCKDSKILLPVKILAAPYIRRNMQVKQDALNKSTRIIALSNFVKETVSKVADAKKIDVVPSIMEPVEGRRSESDYIFYAGTITREKGIFLLFKSIEKMKRPPPVVVRAMGT